VFKVGGGKVELVTTAPFAENGHFLLSPAGIPGWATIIDSFFKDRGLVLRENQLALPGTQRATPSSLSPNGRREFEKFRTSAPHKAFAVSPAAAFGWRSGRRTIEVATADALSACTQHAEDCHVVFADHVAFSEGHSLSTFLHRRTCRSVPRPIPCLPNRS
jgi:hypothetical protein